MLRNLLVGLTLAAAGMVAGLSISASGQDLALGGPTLGPVRAGRAVEAYRMASGVTRKGLPARDAPFEEKRALLAVPAHYGELYAITGHGADAVFWYRDGEGEIRNAVVGGAATRLHRIVSRHTERLEFDYR